MKKLLTIAVAFMLVFSMTSMAAAADNLTTTGELRVRGHIKNTNSFNNDADDGDMAFDERLRIAWKWAVADGLSVNMRTDIHEGTWGINSGPVGRPNSTNDFDRAWQVDRAYIRIDNPQYTLNVGEQYFSIGHGTTTPYNPNEIGFGLRLKMPIRVELNWMKVSEGANDSDDGPDANSDTDLYAIQLSKWEKAWNAGLYWAMRKDYSDADNSPYVIGFFGKTGLGAVTIEGSFDYFGGDMNDTIDYVGTQFWLRLSTPFSKMTTVGFNGYFAAAEDADGTEQQINLISKFSGQSPHESFGLDGEIINVYPSGDIFDPFNTDQGVLGGDLMLKHKASKTVTVGGHIGYAAAQDDEVGPFDGAWYVLLGLQYNWLTNTTLGFQGAMTNPSKNDGSEEDVLWQLHSKLSMKF